MSGINHDRISLLILQPGKAVGQSLDDGTCSQVATTDTGNDYYLAVISQNLCSSIQVSQVFFSDRRRQVQPS